MALSLKTLSQSWSAKNPSKDFWLCAFKNNLGGMKEIYAQDQTIDVNYLRWNDTPLDLAIHQKNKTMIAFLLGLNAKFSSKTQEELDQLVTKEEQEKFSKPTLALLIVQKEKEKNPAASSPKGHRSSDPGTRRTLKPPDQDKGSSGSTETTSPTRRKTIVTSTKDAKEHITPTEQTSLSRASSAALQSKSSQTNSKESNLQDAFLGNLRKENLELKSRVQELELLLENTQLKSENFALKGFKERDDQIQVLKQENKKLKKENAFLKELQNKNCNLESRGELDSSQKSPRSKSLRLPSSTPTPELSEESPPVTITNSKKQKKKAK